MGEKYLISFSLQTSYTHSDLPSKMVKLLGPASPDQDLRSQSHP